MNIFLPYEKDIAKSVRTLDDARLNKQATETYQLLRNAISECNGIEINSYKHHPIYLHYKSNIPFLIAYGSRCCEEWGFRFNKRHKLMQYFAGISVIYNVDEENLSYIPFYVEGAKDSPTCIRTTENVSELYQKKLSFKWLNDYRNNRPPKWTNREIPNFLRRPTDDKKEKYNSYRIREN